MDYVRLRLVMHGLSLSFVWIELNVVFCGRITLNPNFLMMNDLILMVE